MDQFALQKKLSNQQTPQKPSNVLNLRLQINSFGAFDTK